MNTIYYACSEINNFGDYLSRWLVDKITGREFVFSEDMKLLVSGSILKKATEESHVFGAGFMNMFETTNCPNVHFVRGQYSKIQLKMQGNKSKPELFEPAYCLREFFEKPKPTINVGFIPHYIDWDKELHPEWHHIGICIELEEFMRRVLMCKKIVTSSLHAMVVAELFEIPCALVKIGDKIVGDGFKYLDYWSFSGGKPYRPIPINEISRISDKVSTPAKKIEYSVQVKSGIFLKRLEEHLK